MKYEHKINKIMEHINQAVTNWYGTHREQCSVVRTSITKGSILGWSNALKPNTHQSVLRCWSKHIYRPVPVHRRVHGQYYYRTGINMSQSRHQCTAEVASNIYGKAIMRAHRENHANRLHKQKKCCTFTALYSGVLR